MNETAAAAAKSKHPFAGLLAIILAIIVGALFGIFYGQSMWKASGGPVRRLEELQLIKQQKEAGVEGLPAVAAERKREQIAVIDEEIIKVSQLRDDAAAERKTGADVAPHIAWTLTDFVGDVFLQVLKLLVIPLVVTSMICGITSLGDVRKVGRVGLYTIIYYMLTGAIAVVIGIALVQIIQPGVAADDTFSLVTENVSSKADTGVMETLLNVFRGNEGDPGSGMFPSNIFQAATNTNVLALIVFAIVFGAALTTIGEKGKIAIQFFEASNLAIMKMVHGVMFFAPIGIFGLVAGNIAKNGGGEAFFGEINRIGWYVATVLIGLSIHVFVLGGILTVVGKRNPLTYTYNLLRAMLTAVSTSSSSATLPITMECVEENNGVSNRSASFVLPLGATINMDGTALYEAVAVIFIAQSLAIPLSTGKLVIIFLTATLAAVGAAGIPEAGLVTMVIVLQAAGIPMEGIGTILSIDWFLDRMRTTVNVYGDAVGAGVIDRIAIGENNNT